MGTHWKKLTNPNYLGSWDFKQGEERLLTIEKVMQDEVFNPSKGCKEACIVAHLRNSKPMILNKTNCKMVQKLYNTPEIEKWSGASIIVEVKKIKAKGELIDALRIKDEKPRQQQLKQPGPELNFDEPLFCGDCGELVEDTDRLTAEQIAIGTKKTYGVQLCARCGAVRKAAAV